MITRKLMPLSVVVLLTACNFVRAADASADDMYERQRLQDTYLQAAYQHAKNLTEALINLQRVAGVDTEIRAWATHAAYSAAEIEVVAERVVDTGDTTELTRRLAMYQKRNLRDLDKKIG